MLFQLIRYDWTLLKSKISDSETIIGVILLALFGLIIYSSVGQMINVALFARGTTELPPPLDFITPPVRLFILLLMANFWWFSQLFFTGPSMLQPEEHRPLLTHGVSLQRLSSYLLNAAFVHPFSLLFNLWWIVLLFAYQPSWYLVILIVPLLTANQLLIFSIKERFYYWITKRAKQAAFAFFIIVLAILQGVVPQLEAPETLEQWLASIPSFNQWLYLLPGGWFVGMTSLSQSFSWLMGLTAIAVTIAYVLRSHLLTKMQSLILQVSKDSKQRSQPQDRLWHYLSRWFGYDGGKGLYYVLLHPYARFTMAVGLIFPMIYLPLMFAEEGSIMESNTGLFVLVIFLCMPLIYASMLLLGNLFGYEYDEWLAHNQFPRRIQHQIEQRYRTYLIILLVLGFLILAAALTFFPLRQVVQLLPSMLFVIAGFFLLFQWTAFSYVQRIPKRLMNFTNPLFPTSIGMVIGILQLIVLVLAVVPYGPLEPYKPVIHTAVSAAIGWYFWTHRHSFSTRYQKTILPRLWSRS
ncbi:MAG: hypothetical protein ACQETE_04150 [Bacteroidota bacterium]